MVMLYLDAVSTKYLYQDMKKYVLIVLMNHPQKKPGYKTPPISISIILWRKMCMVFIKVYLIINPPFKSSWLLLDIFSITRNVDFGGTRKCTLIGT